MKILDNFLTSRRRLEDMHRLRPTVRASISQGTTRHLLIWHSSINGSNIHAMNLSFIQHYLTDTRASFRAHKKLAEKRSCN